MSDTEIKNNPDGPSEPADTNPGNDPDRPMEEVNTDPSNTDDVSNQIARLENDLAEKTEEHLRALAELDNLRKRMVKEREEQRKYAVTKFARELLGVADNLSRAIESVNMDDLTAEAQNLLGGVEATRDELQKALAKMGIEEIEAGPGTKFDPNKHEVMFEDPSADVPPGHISQVLEKGYQIHDRLLRPARVGIAKGADKNARGVDTNA
jgi:molecular chaperone GrpE